MRFLVAVLLLFSVTPGVAEIVEDAVHWVAAAELPDHGGETVECEHHCTPLAHHCGCHGSMSAQVSATAVTPTPACDSTLLVMGAIVAVRNRSCDPPPIRPPIA